MIRVFVRTFRAVHLLFNQTVAERYKEITIGWNSLYREQLAGFAGIQPNGSNPQVEDSPRWINLGYWTESSDTLDKASQRLAVKLAEAANLRSSDRILDVGCGFGDSTILWRNRAQQNSGDSEDSGLIVGLNITEFHARYAHARARPLQGARISFVIGDATTLPLREAYFHKILALECAFHFQTRNDFLREAYNALQPGGTLVIADVVLKNGIRRLVKPFDRLMNRRWPKHAAKLAEHFTLCPYSNLISSLEYWEDLRQLGYSNIKFENISARVFPPFIKYWNDRTNPVWAAKYFRSRGLSEDDTGIHVTAWLMYMRLLIFGFHFSDYVIVVAQKPR